MYFARRWRRQGIGGWVPRKARGGIGGGSGKRGRKEERGQRRGAPTPLWQGPRAGKSGEIGGARRGGAQRIAEKSRRRAGRAKKVELTTPDLVLLSLLAERPMHGYEANLELERREIRDWAGISRPQVYYSLEKLARAGLIRSSETDEPAAGPERSTFETTEKGRAALADALEREEWARHRDRRPSLTWLR